MLLRKRSPLSALLLVALGAAVVGYEWTHRDALGFSKPEPVAQPAATAPDDNARLAALAAAHRSDEEVEVTGRVIRLLDDDVEGDRHQRFLLQVGETALVVLVAHNIDVGARVPVAVDDELRVRGEYVWNDQGGLLHWTHRNPARDPRHEGGWIQLGGRRYE